MQASPAVCTWSRGIQLGHVVQHEAFHKAMLVRLQEVQHLLHLLQGSSLHLDWNVLVFSPHPVLQITHTYILTKDLRAPLACFVVNQCIQLYNAMRLGNRLVDVPTQYNIQPAHIQPSLPKARGTMPQLRYILVVLMTQVTSSKCQLQRQMFCTHKGQDGTRNVVKLLLRCQQPL